LTKLAPNKLLNLVSESAGGLLNWKLPESRFIKHTTQPVKTEHHLTGPHTMQPKGNFGDSQGKQRGKVGKNLLQILIHKKQRQSYLK
jgi:hypothetical protein